MSLIGDPGFELTATMASGGTNRATLDPSSPWSGGSNIVIGPGDPYYGGSTPATPYGQNCLVLSSNFAISQTLASLAAGTYTFSVASTQVMAISGGGNQGIKLVLDGATLATFSVPSDRAWHTYTASPVTLAAGNHVLSIVGTGGGNDNALIDNVQAIAQAAPDTLTPGTLTTGTPTATSVSLSLSGTTGGTTPYSVQFQQAPDASGSPGTWANLGSAGTATSYAATGLTPGTKSWFRAIITDAATSPQSATTAAVAATMAALVLPTPGTLSIAADDGSGTDVLSYTAPTAGTYPLDSIRLYSGTASGAQGPMAIATNGPGVARSFTLPSSGSWYILKFFDSANNAVASNEVQGHATPAGGVTLTQLRTELGNQATTLSANLGNAMTAIVRAELATANAVPVADATYATLATKIGPAIGAAVNAALDARLTAIVAALAQAATAAQLAPLATANALSSVASTATAIKAFLDGVGPLADAVSILTGYYVLTSDGQTVIEYNRQGVEIDRYPATGRTTVNVPQVAH